MKIFLGFGFGAIQGGLFLYEAFHSGQFNRLVVAEVQPDTVRALREAKGHYRVNIATPTGIEVREVHGVEVLNPLDAQDRACLIQALAEADELATALPSVDFFDRGEGSVARLIAEACAHRSKPGVVYTGENHNHAAELLEAAVRSHGANPDSLQFLNTVIGKMSGVVTDPADISAQHLAPIAASLPRAFLVESFNRILISRITIAGFQRGIIVFEEKQNLLPFEEAKLYGHNATHALLGLMAHRHGLRFMSEITGLPDLLEFGRGAFLKESGGALIKRHAGVDPLFTPAGYRAYAEDLLQRMVNPFLRDAVERVIRDPQRKRGWDDRLIGTMRRALEAGIPPVRFALGARIALDLLSQEQPGGTASARLRDVPSGLAHARTEPAAGFGPSPQSRADELLDLCWKTGKVESDMANRIKELIDHAS